jgi:hypothetical protein
MNSRADAFTCAGLIGSIALLTLFLSVASGIHFSFNIVDKALDSIPNTVVHALGLQH